ncbi:unnamed protein product [Lactuca saligna]|uniref:Disease resistance protein At4g27190-like leucine-rich repeats domain-containing protein n=1 Tax=Lactuca saligna TaxID=75948 RepID=A0AA35V7A8_LACSI|nr:unnamed protein product [Lactuca saligna]
MAFLISLPFILRIHLCNISMPSNMSYNQPFLNKEMLIPKLEILKILGIDKLKEIWPCQFSGNDEVNTCMLREIHVKECDNLVNLLPTNPMSLLHHVEEISVFSMWKY